MAKTIDQLPKFLGIEDLVTQAKSSFQNFATQLVLANIIAWQPWLGSFFFKRIIEAILNYIFKILIDKGELGAFIINERILTSQQAYEYRQSVYKILMSKTEQEWIDAEKNANEAFRKLVSFNS